MVELGVLSSKDMHLVVCVPVHIARWKGVGGGWVGGGVGIGARRFGAMMERGSEVGACSHQ
jgi:hypothetical protein